MYQFPDDVIDTPLMLTQPSTYINLTLSAIAQVQTVVPVGDDGELNLDFRGFTMEMVASAPPQSGRPTIVDMGAEQYELLKKLSYQKGEHQEICERVFRSAKRLDDRLLTRIVSTDVVLVREAQSRGGSSEVMDLLREIIKQVAK